MAISTAVVVPMPRKPRQRDAENDVAVLRRYEARLAGLDTERKRLLDDLAGIDRDRTAVAKIIASLREVVTPHDGDGDAADRLWDKQFKPGTRRMTLVVPPGEAIPSLLVKIPPYVRPLVEFIVDRGGSVLYRDLKGHWTHGVISGGIADLKKRGLLVTHKDGDPPPPPTADGDGRKSDDPDRK